MSFASDLNDFAEKAKGRADAIVRKIVIDVGTSLVMKSPVGDAKYWINPAPKGYTGGRFRGNWQYALGNYSTDTTQDIDKSGSISIGRVTSGVPDDAGGKVHYITNSLPYAKRLEEGWSKRQAPVGMVGITVVEFEPIVQAAAKAFL